MTHIPFPHERPARALRAEDAFMQCHGGPGARAIYLAVEGASRLAGAVTASCGRLFAGPSGRHIERLSLRANPIQETPP